MLGGLKAWIAIIPNANSLHSSGGAWLVSEISSTRCFTLRQPVGPRSLPVGVLGLDVDAQQDTTAGVLHDGSGGLRREGGVVITTSLTPHPHTHALFQLVGGGLRKVSIVPTCPLGAMRGKERRNQLVLVVLLRFT